MDSNQLSIIIQAVLEKSGLTKELASVQEIFNKNIIKIMPQLETASLKNNLKEVSKLISNSINEAYKNAGNLDFKISDKDVFKIINASMKEMNVTAMASKKQMSNLANSVLAFRDNNTKMSKEISNSLTSMYKTLTSGANLSEKELKELETRFASLKLQVREVDGLGKSFSHKMKDDIENFMSWGFATGLTTEAIGSFRTALNELKDVNTLLTEVSKANDKLSASQLAEIGDNAFDVASKYGKVATDYLSGVQEASRAGYENAEAMAELSTAAQGAGDMTAEVANQFIIATDKAYKLNGSVTELTKVLDGVNYITNHNAVNMSELSEAMTIVGSTADSFGVETNELTAALGTMASTTQQSGSEVARAFRAILLNIRQVSDEEEGIDAEGLTKYEKACNALGVSLKETRNGVLETRDAMDVLKELSVEYNKLEENDLRRTELLNSVGGKLRATQLDALLRQWDTYEEMLKQYESGTGSMAKEAEKTAQSWEGSLNRLSNTWTDTVENVANSDAIITAINGFNGLLSVVNEVTSVLGSVSTIGLGASIFAGFKSVDYLKMPVCPLHI